jgi:hypothetical protein
MAFDSTKFDVAKYDAILEKGLSYGLGERGSQVCIEAAICQTLGLPHGDDPGCVAASVRSFKIALNDSMWSSSKARAAGLHDLGLAQLGSKGVVSGEAFCKILAERTIRELIPALFREAFPDNKACLEAAKRCEDEGTEEAARDANKTASAADAANMAAYAADAANMAAYAANAANYANYAANYAADAANYAAADKWLLMSAKIALETLKQLNSPGVALL